MTLYEFLKFGHIVSVTALVGGGLLLTVLLGIAAFGRSADSVVTVDRIGRWIGLRFFLPALLLLLGFGVWAVLEGDLDFGDAWITIGFVAFGISFVLGPTVHERNARALKTAIEEQGPTSESAVQAVRQDFFLSLAELAMLIFAVWAMTAKPGL